MQLLRTQVDRIDLQLLKLLQQRTKLSRRIGEAKRQHQSAVYVPERERELLLRLGRLNQGALPDRALAAIFREILSSSRAAQGQGAVGLLPQSAATILPSARLNLGACDEFEVVKNWPALAAGLAQGSFALALLTGAELALALQTERKGRELLQDFCVAGDFTAAATPSRSLAERIFILIPKRERSPQSSDRILVLIECKYTGNAVKSWFKSMAKRFLQAEMLELPAGSRLSSAGALLMRTSLSSDAEVDAVLSELQTPETSVTLLGRYGGSDIYAG